MVNSQVVASAFLIAGAVLFAQWQRQTPTPQPKFIEIRPGLYRLNYVINLHVVAPVQVATWLVESSPNSWIMIDGGLPFARSQRAILQGLQTTLSSAEDTLRLVLGQQPGFVCSAQMLLLLYQAQKLKAPQLKVMLALSTSMCMICMIIKASCCLMMLM